MVVPMHPLTAFREANSATAADLARRLGVSRATIHRWETGERKPSREKLAAIKRELRIEPGDILEYEAAQ